jgi:phosphohistidine phosphatase
MLVTFLRHADAEPDAGSDFTRKLTPKGLDQSEKVARFCSRNGLQPELILASPVLRAAQTAEILSKKLGDIEIISCPWLACGMTPESCLNELHGYARLENLFVVGHEPDFSRAIANLIGCGDPSSLKIRKASLTSIEMDGFHPGGGNLQYSIPVRLM